MKLAPEHRLDGQRIFNREPTSLDGESDPVPLCFLDDEMGAGRQAQEIVINAATGAGASSAAEPLLYPSIAVISHCVWCSSGPRATGCEELKGRSREGAPFSLFRVGSVAQHQAVAGEPGGERGDRALPRFGAIFSSLTVNRASRLRGFDLRLLGEIADDQEVERARGKLAVPARSRG